MVSEGRQKRGHPADRTVRSKNASLTVFFRVLGKKICILLLTLEDLLVFVNLSQLLVFLRNITGARTIDFYLQIKWCCI